MRKLPLWLPLCLGLLASLPAQALDFNHFQQAETLYQRGVAGDDDATDQAQGLLLALHEEEPGNPLVMVYLGGTYALQGRDAWMPWSKTRLAEKGLDQMAKALKFLPKEPVILPDGRSLDLHVRIVCAINFTQVPKFFGRFEQGQLLFEQLLADPRLSDFSARSKAELYYYAGAAAAKGDQEERARGLLGQALASDAGGDYDAPSRELLEELGR